MTSTTVDLEILIYDYGHGLQTARQEILMSSLTIHSYSHTHALPIRRDTDTQ